MINIFRTYMPLLAVASCHLASSAAAQRSIIRFMSPTIVRVTYAPQAIDETASNNTTICVLAPEKVAVKRSETAESITFRSDSLIVEQSKLTGAVTFRDASTGRTLLMERQQTPHEAEAVVNERIVYDDKTARIEQTANGKVTVKDIIRRDTLGTTTRYTAHFVLPDATAQYGLGSHMEDYMNLLGKTLWLTQHNLKITVPVLNSPDGYGLFFDAGCAMKYSSVKDGQNYDMTMQLEAAQVMDYYFIKGATMQDVVAGYRQLTGEVSMMPRYFFGYTQSKERYVSSDDIINTLKEYRRRHVPLDLIVQDWNYWPEGWGYLKMDRRHYPSPRALADSVHSLNARIMVSIWPNPQKCPQEKDFREKGYMLEYSVYDAFNPAARKYYWKYVNDEFFSNGFDAWWCDDTEPLDADWNQTPTPNADGTPYNKDNHERRWKLNRDLLSDCLGAERSSLFSLFHSRGIYENQRLQQQNTAIDKRVVNLTRSGYAGQQRYGTIVWNGDTYAGWEAFRQQIPSGLNYLSTGNPYWTVDVGAFFTRSSRRWFYTGQYPDGVTDDKYKEYYTRMFQWATFLPMLRSHGTDTPREIWNFGEPGTQYYDAILSMIRMRYALTPTTYSMAWKQHRGSYTMARPLAFDFAKDTKVLDLKDEYMFGDFLVCPVTAPSATNRSVYLPEGVRWHDYWTSQTLVGGQTITAAAPIDKLPLYVREGSIVVTTEVADYTEAQRDKPLTVTVYEGRDAQFTLYDDAWDGYAFEQGEYAEVPMKWDQKRNTLTIGKRQGKFATMPKATVMYVGKAGGKMQTVKYTGKQLKIHISD